MAEITEREQLIFEIAQMEWDMFQHVYNTGGRASCQDDPDTFFKMRMSQWLVYSDELLESYAADCREALAAGKNFYFEKYTRMMETTYPEEYEKVKQYLPEISEKTRELAEKIVAVHLKWDEEVMRDYPGIRERGRVVHTEQDSKLAGSSMESYLRAELLTYSERTLSLLYAETEAARAAEGNLVKDIIENETKFYGYASLEEAEKKHRNDKEGGCN